MTHFTPRKTVRDTAGGVSATGGWLGRFWTDQRGSMSYMALAGSLIMMIFGGIGIDMMNAERDRNRMQHTLDRAVLAAANLNNTRDPKTVVEDYFHAMNLDEFLSNVDPKVDAGSKRVKAEGDGMISSSFLPLLGITALGIDGVAVAENAVAPTEISLVLDVSGSMSGAKLTQLKLAATNFVKSVLGDGGDTSRVTVSVIPYNATVNLGPELTARYALDLDHTFSTCATFNSVDFDTTILYPTQALQQIAHFDPISNGQLTLNTPWCSTGSTNTIIAHSADPVFLETFINGLQAQGNTAIDLGMKWGTALLDPSAQPVVADLSAKGLAPTSAKYRPAPYGSKTNKFIVVMTDGENTQQLDLKPNMKLPTDMSDVWVDDNGTDTVTDDRWSILVKDNPGDNNDVYYWPHTGTYTNGPFSYIQGGVAGLVNGVAKVTGVTETDSIVCSSYKADGANSGNTAAVEGTLSNSYGTVNKGNIPNGVATGWWKKFGSAVTGAAKQTRDCTKYAPVRLSWQELFGTVKVSEYANTWYWKLYSDGKKTYDQYYASFYSWEIKVDGPAANDRLHRVCKAAKDQEIVVYSIGVEAPAAGLAAMSDCASSPAHFFDVNGSELVDTFASISDMLVELRLVE